MLEGMYSAAAGMTAQQQRLDALSNDVANVNTTGYKRVRVAFRDLLYTPAGLATAPGVQEGAGAAATMIGRGAAQGALQRTDQPLDVAIAGPGFLMVQGEGGRRELTRDGHLRVDAQGRLGTAAGQLLVPPVQVPRGTDPSQISIAPDGRVTVGDRAVGRLSLVTVASPDALESAGANSFLPTQASGAPVAAGAATRVEQGALEASNVDLGEAMASMIETQRAYSLASRAIQTQDKVAEIANGVKR